jgi:hypothetical protein
VVDLAIILMVYSRTPSLTIRLIEESRLNGAHCTPLLPLEDVPVDAPRHRDGRVAGETLS